jgi:methylated-DNA-[protein]-cysteine S-methyltransferase
MARSRDSHGEMVAFSTSLGWMAALWRQNQLAGLTFGFGSAQAALKQLGSGAAPPSQPTDIVRSTIARLQRYAEGEPDSFLDIPIELHGNTKFQRQVIYHCRRIPAGETLTYGELAARAGSPKAARAVGQVMATNRIPIIIPCHRVVSAQGRLGGFSAPGGLNTKRRLLRLESVASPKSQLPSLVGA